MEQLIEALQIFLKYKNSKYPTHCEHDVLYIMEVSKEDVSPEDVRKLKKLGFFWSKDEDCFMSFHYGSA
jgi:hypothetical protein